MEVTCDRCGAEYEFEETLISVGGTTVKCTACGHLFKVHRSPAEEASEASTPGGDAPAAWTLRRPDASTVSLDSLAALTRGIRAGTYGPADEISRSGRAWRRLADIPELQTFFSSDSMRPPELGLALPRGVSSMPPPTTTGPTGDRPRSGPPPRQRTASIPPPPPPPPSRARRTTRSTYPPPSPGIAAPGPGAPPAQARTGGSTAPPAQAAAQAPSTPTPPGESPAEASGAPAATPTAGEPGGTAAASAPPAPGESHGPLIMAMVGLVLLAGALGLWLVWPRIGRTPTVQTDPAAVFVQQGDAALADHRLARFDQAVTDYTKALAFHPYDGHILSSLSRVYAVWAQEVRFAQAATEASGTRDLGRLRAMEREAARLSAAAKQHAETAARKNPGNEEAEVALADAMRLTGNLVGARNELDRARSSEATPDAEALRVAALLAIAEHNGSLSAGRDFAEQAVAADPALLRARALLCRIHAATGERADAERQLEAIRAQAAPHPLFDELRALLDAQRDGGVPGRSAGDAGTGTGRPDAPVMADSVNPDVAGSRPGEASSASASARCIRAERLLEQGKVAAAEAIFEEVLRDKPTYARARTGLGYVALEQNRPHQALRHFRPVARRGRGDALIGLGQTYRKLGKRRDALASYRRYVALHPFGSRLSIAKRQIELLSEQLEP